MSIEERLVKIETSYDGLSKRVDDLRSDMNQRFGQVNQRINDLRSDMNQRFDAVDKRFDDINKRLSLFTWTITGWFTLLTILIVLFKFI